ncbi:MAG: DsbA family protein [Pseudomonadota bacterium]
MIKFRQLGFGLAAALTFATGPVAAQGMSAEEREAFRAEVRAFLLDNPEVLMEAMDVLREREALAEARADAQLLIENRAEIFEDGISWVGGNPDGDITVVEFLDYRCGYCRRAHEEMVQLLEADGNIRWVVKEFPILGPDSDAAARMAVATLKTLGNDAYWRLHDTLMKFQGPVNPQTMPVIAQRAEIDFAAIEGKLASADTDEHILRVRALGQALNISGTPAFVIGDTVLRGYLPLRDMQAIVAQERS